MTALSKEEIQTLALKGYADPVFFCRTFLSEWFPKDIPWVHRGILAVVLKKTDFLLTYGELDKILRHFVVYEDPFDTTSKSVPIFSPNAQGGLDFLFIRFLIIMMPRGFAKTTLLNACILYLILYHDCRFPLYVGDTGKSARMQLHNVKQQLENNDLIKIVFGNKIPSRQDSQKWTEDFIQTKEENPIFAAARGSGEQIRGVVTDGTRPDRIIMDDLENEESVSSPDQRQKTLNWFFRTLLPVLSRQDTSSSLLGLGTLLSGDALLPKLMRNPKFAFVRFGALDLDGEPLWPDNFSMEQLESEKQSYTVAGQLSAFYAEYLSVLRDDDSARFREGYFKVAPQPSLVAKAIVIDPAISDSSSADDCVIAVVGMAENGKIHVCDVWGKKGASPREQIDTYFDMAILHKHQLAYFGVESIAYQAALVHLLREEMHRRNFYFEITEIKHNTKKAERILGVLQPRYAAGYITHERDFPKLVQQLLDFDGKGHDDYPDAVAMAVTLLDPFSAQAASSDPGEDSPLDEDYDALMEEFYACP